MMKIKNARTSYSTESVVVLDFQVALCRFECRGLKWLGKPKRGKQYAINIKSEKINCGGDRRSEKQQNNLILTKTFYYPPQRKG